MILSGLGVGVGGAWVVVCGFCGLRLPGWVF